MENKQISTSKTIAINVVERDDLTFFYDTESKQTATVPKSTPICQIQVSKLTFDRLMSGSSTFEQEVSDGEIVISGDSQILREIGKFFRSK